MKIFGINFGKKAVMRQIDTPFNVQYTSYGWTFNDGVANKMIKDGYNLNSSVYSIVKIMQDKFSVVPWMLYKVKDKQKAKRYKLLTESLHVSTLDKIRLKASAFDEVVDNRHPLLELFNKPNTYQNGEDFRNEALMFRKLTGATAFFVNKGLAGTSEPLELNILPSQYIVLFPDPSLLTYARVAYNITGAYVNIPVENFIYWKYANPNWDLTGCHLYGMSPLKAAARVLCADNENMDAQAYTFHHKGATGLFTPKDVESANALQGQSDQIREAIDLRTNGRDYGKPRTYLHAPLDLHTFGMTAQEMETIAAHTQNKEDLCNPFNFPAYLLQMAKGTDSKYNDAIKYLLTNTIYNDLTSYRAIWNEQIIPQFGLGDQYYFDFDLTAFPEMQEEIEKMISGATMLVDRGILNRNEARVMMKYDEAEDPLMNEFTVGTGVQPLSAAFDVMTDINPDI